MFVAHTLFLDTHAGPYSIVKVTHLGIHDLAATWWKDAPFQASNTVTFADSWVSPTFVTGQNFKKETSLFRQHPAWIPWILLMTLRIATGQPDEDQSCPKAQETNIDRSCNEVINGIKNPIIHHSCLWGL